MQKERLLKLADYLENEVAEDDFNMAVWRIEIPDECGTVCCALGHACNIPEFAKAGLHMDVRFNAPCFGDHRYYEAGGAFFEIAWDQSRYLFSPLCYPYFKPSVAKVVERIRTFVGVAP